jgi:menaquinone-dependent protoporphyrinogen oxidase
MKVLVTAATRHGATREIAQAIAEVLGDRGLDPMVLEPEQVDGVEGYDAVVLGSAVYAGHWLKPAKELVDRCGGALAARPVWLFSSGPVGDPPKPEEDPVDVAELLAATGAREHRVLAGRLVRRRLSFPEKAVVSALRVPEGDFRDWAEITGWAAGIATALRSGSPAQAGHDERAG